LQLATFLRSVDYRGLKWHLSPFRINTSKILCTFCISLIYGHFKSPIINTSTKNDFMSPGINTSRKTGGGGSSCNSSCNWEFAARARRGESAVAQGRRSAVAEISLSRARRSAHPTRQAILSTVVDRLAWL